MLYFANPCGSDAVTAAMLAGHLGYIDTPAQGNRRPVGVTWCADNGCYSDNWNADTWWSWLSQQSLAPDAGACLFAVAPDVVGDAAATLELSRPWMDRIRGLGFPVAFVAQDGQENLPVPWDLFDVLFVGGTTEWKLSDHAVQLVDQAKTRGKWAHCGRVNTRKRLNWAHSIGCDSSDGTTLTRGPDKNLRSMLRWLDDIAHQGALFGGAR